MTIRKLNTAELHAVAGGGYPLPEPAAPDNPFGGVGNDGSPFVGIGLDGSPSIGIGGGGRDWWNPGWIFGPPTPEPVLPVKPVGPGFP